MPHTKQTLLRNFRVAIGQTDEKHGHVRPGYTVEELESLLKGKFTIDRHKTYSKFFSECLDTLIALGFGLLKKEEHTTPKGVLVTGQDLRRHEKIFKAYSLIYPLAWFMVRLDMLLFWCSGYMLIIRATANNGQGHVYGRQSVGMEAP